MKSQWECLLQNLGEWQGSFTRLLPQGEILDDTPTVVSLEGLNNNQTIRQTIRKYLPLEGGQENVLEYSSLARSVLFFENGAFSQGSIQLAPFSEFGAELGLIDGDRRLRLVQLFDRSNSLDKLTLIREKLAGSEGKELPALTVEQLLGEWQGEATTIYPDWRSPDSYSTNLKIALDGSDRLVQKLSFGSQIIASSARIDGAILNFEEGELPVQVLLLPDGASSTCPLQLKMRQRFFLEVGWLRSSNLRYRMIRSYSNKGEWVSLTLVKERKIG